jgi:eukaryotic-like serine/threonine-protein kinase
VIEKIGHYTIVSELGRGGMGVVYKAHEESLNRFVALKVLGEHLADDHSYVQRFAREAQSAAKLNHPNIVQVYAIAEDQGLHYFAMEYITGTSLQKLLRDRGKMDTRQATRLILQTAAGLGAAHEADIIHRDIKPANILITDRGLVKIADFGLALMASGAASRLTATGMFMGTPGYLSPEQCLDKDVDHRTDIYSLGVTFFEMLTGGIPFKADSPLALLRQIIEVEPPDVRELNPEVDEEARRILKLMMAKKKEERYPSCQELITDLQRYLERAGTSREEVSGVAAGTSAAFVASAPATAAAGLVGAQPTVRSTTPARSATPPPTPLAAGPTAQMPSNPPPAPPAMAAGPTVVVASAPAVAPPRPAPPTVLQPATPAPAVAPPAVAPPPPLAPRTAAPPPAVELVHTPPPKRGSSVGLIVAIVVVVGFLGVAGAAAVAWKVGLFKRARTTMAASSAAAAGTGSQAESVTGGQPVGAGNLQPAAGGASPSTPGEGFGSTGPIQAEAGGSPGASTGLPGAGMTGGGTVSASGAQGGTYPYAVPPLPPPATRSGKATGGAPSTGYQPPAAGPLPRGVAVVGIGERTLASEAESYLEKALEQAGARVVDEKGLPEVAQLLDGEPGMADLAQALKGRAHYLLLVRAEFLGERPLQYMGRSETQLQSRLHVATLDLTTDEPVGSGFDEKVGYTGLTVGRVVEDTLRPVARRLRTGVEER